MKAYLITTGTLFGLIVPVHIWRAIEEGAQTAKDPIVILVTVLAAALSIWAWRLLRTSSRL
jgi:hypothetical protein